MSTRTDPIFQNTTQTNSVNLGITTLCSMSCPKCSVNVPGVKNTPLGKHAYWYDIHEAGILMRPLRRVHVTGGEPTIHPAFGFIAAYVRDWFQAEYVTLETNGAGVLKYLSDIDRRFDRVFVTHYEKDAIYPGSPDNSEVIRRAGYVLGDKLIHEAPVRHERGHELLTLGMLGVETPCSKYFDPGLPCGWYNNKLYGCCVTFGIDPSLGIPVTKDWRDRIAKRPMGCGACCYRGT